MLEYKTAEVDGARVFYREAGPRDAPALLLLHGFPSASHQFRGLFDALEDRFHLVAPDYPGFGHSDAPEGRYTFDFLADVVEKFVEAIGLSRFAMYVFDYGAPVGFRLATRHPEWITGLVVQNGNAYEEGLGEQAKAFIYSQNETEVRGMLTEEFTRSQYETGARGPVAPDGWVLDQYFLDQPDRAAIQVQLAFDYHTNVESYPRWQAWLREHQPPTLVVWGRNDPFFLTEGGEKYRDDVPDAEVHLFDTGHFALEEDLDEIAALIAEFLPTLRP
ncbi:alpha/beta fold hydrolase [Kibdelosporangium phytohabitans]|uniref:Alpha/beta hydrolase n=1 Tax=Kibdelosporangium phytohabitans TaxID=860235 RepID=A0A0N9I7Y1_9PSEU|nr:alpha/beta hydrolase [Kibdelosporangium phytohabitans]ALG12289.1 alpha/beta hydrolase [Kibdelosporangium phytohabitans]MBE1463844.1 pimeloyl-ACP methyl ester carboxylesterase [Kibdelosporangium phytohabitans]